MPPGVIVVVYCWTIPNAFPDFGGSDYWTYGGLYGASVAISVFSFLNIVKAVRSYTDGSEATKTSGQTPPGTEPSQGPSAIEPKTP